MVIARQEITLTLMKDISSVTRYYRLRKSKPSKPTTNPPSERWVDAEPSYVSGYSLYFVDLTVFTDDTFNYSEVSKSSSYEAAKDTYDKVISRGENLIVNGTALLADNTNFTKFTYDGSETYYAGGSFKYSSDKSFIGGSDEYIAVDVSQEYTLSYYIKNNSTSSINYDFLRMYDIDKLEIKSDHVMWVDGSTTTLAKDLNNGDTIVYLESVAGFNTTTTYYYRQGFIFWNYKNSFGYQYGTETYSRNRWDSLWDDATAFDTKNNTITLKEPWSNGQIPSGTPVSQCNAGNNYIYLNNSFTLPVADTWVYMTGNMNGVGKNNELYKFREGTAYVTVGWYLNYKNVASCTTWLSTISLTKNAGTKEVSEAVDGLQTATDKVAEAVKDNMSTTESNMASINDYIDRLETKVDDDINNMKSDINTLQTKVDLQLTEDAVNIQIDKKLQNGVNKVETSTGFTFDENGMSISKSNSPINTQITENGMVITDIENDPIDVLLTANKDGVDAKNLRATTYLIIGDRSRFENYGTNRTGCFWIGNISSEEPDTPIKYEYADVYMDESAVLTHYSISTTEFYKGHGYAAKVLRTNLDANISFAQTYYDMMLTGFHDMENLPNVAIAVKVPENGVYGLKISYNIDPDFALSATKPYYLVLGVNDTQFYKGTERNTMANNGFFKDDYEIRLEAGINIIRVLTLVPEVAKNYTSSWSNIHYIQLDKRATVVNTTSKTVKFDTATSYGHYQKKSYCMGTADNTDARNAKITYETCDSYATFKKYLPYVEVPFTAPYTGYYDIHAITQVQGSSPNIGYYILYIDGTTKMQQKFYSLGTTHGVKLSGIYFTKGRHTISISSAIGYHTSDYTDGYCDWSDFYRFTYRYYEDIE